VEKHIFKYPANLETRLPKGAKILTIQIQNGTIFLWAEVELDKETEPRPIQIVGTGMIVPDKRVYISTVQDGPFVWHLYELLR
jgi:hypothetical protein